MISCIIVLIMLFAHLNSNGQNPYKTFNRDHRIALLRASFMRLKSTSDIEYLEAAPTLGMRFGYNYVFSLGNFYGVGTGASIGYVKFAIRPTDPEKYMYELSNILLNINVPIYIRRHYPFNNRMGMEVKTGINTSNTFTSSAKVIVEDVLLYDLDIEKKTAIQFGVFFELGITYCLKNSNFFLVSLAVNKILLNTINIGYEYYENNQSIPAKGNLEFTSSIGISINYNFRAKNE
jgi:hypothetical protein